MTALRETLLRLIPLLLAALICLVCVTTSLRAESAFDQIRAEISTLAGSDYAKPLILGVTEQGRPIFGIAITDPAAAVENKARIVIVAGQHGNEPAAAFSAAELAIRWANDEAFADLRQNAVVMIIPVANPDGLAVGTRHDSSGLDPNRDWNRRSLIETATIARTIDRWKPHLILDEHEWSQTDGYIFDCVELSGVAPNHALVTLGKRIREQAMPAEVSAVDSLPGRDASLFHRHFLARGYLTYLIETSPEQSAAAKQRLYIQLSMALSRQAVTHRKRIESCSASSKTCRLPEQVAVWREPRPPVAGKASLGAEAMIGMAALYCLLLLSGQLKRSTVVWAREYRPLAPRGSYVPGTPFGVLPEITYRSRASRLSKRGR